MQFRGFAWRYDNARAISIENEILSLHGNGRVRSRMYCRRFPRGRYSEMIRIRVAMDVPESVIASCGGGGARQSPIRVTMLGCRACCMSEISRYKYFSTLYSVECMTSLIATSIPRYSPLYTQPNDPFPSRIHSLVTRMVSKT